MKMTFWLLTTGTLILLSLIACSHKEANDQSARFCQQKKVQAICDAYKTDPVQNLLVSLDSNSPDAYNNVEALIEQHNGELLFSIDSLGAVSVRLDWTGFTELQNLDGIDSISLDEQMFLHRSE